MKEGKDIEQCPFCGHVELIRNYRVFTFTHMTDDYLICPKCSKMFEPKKTEPCTE